MTFLLVVGGLGAAIGFFLGVVAMMFCGRIDGDTRPTPHACAYPHGDCPVTQHSSNTT